MNQEIKSFLSMQPLKNDHFLAGLQEQLGAGLAALGSILTTKLTDPEKDLTLSNQAVETLVEAGQLFANVHQAMSQKRRFDVTPFLNPECKAASISLPVDDFLFGTDFLSKVRSNKEIKKAATEIKRPARVEYVQSTAAGSSGLKTLNWKRPYRKPRKKEDHLGGRPRNHQTKRLGGRNHYYRRAQPSSQYPRNSHRK